MTARDIASDARRVTFYAKEIGFTLAASDETLAALRKLREDEIMRAIRRPVHAFD